MESGRVLKRTKMNPEGEVCNMNENIDESVEIADGEKNTEESMMNFHHFLSWQEKLQLQRQHLQ